VAEVRTSSVRHCCELPRTRSVRKVNRFAIAVRNRFAQRLVFLHNLVLLVLRVRTMSAPKAREKAEKGVA